MYTSVDEVKDYLGITGTGDDRQIERVVAAAQQKIDNYAGFTFEATSDTTRYFDAVGRHIDGNTLYFDTWLYSATTVTNGDSTVITSGQYALIERNRAPYFAIRLLSQSGKLWTYSSEWMNAISITGRWGYGIQAPDDIQQAATRFAAWLYRQRDAQMFDVTVIEPGVILKPQAIPVDVRHTIDAYRWRV